MSVVIVRPSSLISKDGDLETTSNTGGAWATGTDANISGYTGDQLDATGIRNVGATPRWFTLALGSPTITAGEFVARVGGLARWTSSTAGKTISCMPYVLTDGAPGYSAGLTTTVAGPVTSEPSYIAQAWSLTQVAGLGLSVFLDGDTTAGTRPSVWELGATLYTLQLATAVPSVTTITGSTTPVIPVTVAAVIGWEAASYDWQGLRKITVEVRVELGGSGVGLGALMTTGTVDTYFTASGSKVVNVTLPGSVANGTYVVYSRATRHRENEPSVSPDQVGAWSSGVALTMSAVAPVAPTVALAASDMTDTVTISVTPVSSAGYATPSVSVQRSTDLGLTWVAVRNGTNIVSAFAVPTVVIDYEAPRGVVLNYRAQTLAYLSTVLNAGAWSANYPATIALDTWNLKLPQLSALNIIDSTVIGTPGEAITEDLGVFRALDRRYPVIVSGTLGGWDGDLTIRVGNTAEWSALKAVIEAQLIIYIESPFGWAKYARLLPGASRKMSGSSTLPRGEITVQYVETSAPVGTVPILPVTITLTIDGGIASTTSFADILDGGIASTVSFAGIVDGGSV